MTHSPSLNPGDTVSTPAPDPRPLYHGKLSIEQDHGQPPLLFLSFRCNACRRHHHHSWGINPDGSPDMGAHPRQPHCDRPDLHPTGYSITPADTPANARTFARFGELHTQHQRRAARRAARGDTR